MPSQTTDLIYIRELRIDAVVGIYEWEQRVRQTISIDLEMAADVRKAAVSDAIEDTLNYKAVAERITRCIEESRFKLIETLAERIAAILLNEFKIAWVEVVVGKPGAVQGSRDVRVIIARGERA